MKKIVFNASLVIIIGISFFYHASLFSPILNSDDAIVALMIRNFHLPQDLYYWGANRFGSLIPLIGQLFYKIFHFSPVVSESLTHYLLLIAGYLGFASLFNSMFNRIIFAVIWFLPPVRMLDVLTLSQGEQYCLIGIAVFLFKKIYETPIEKYYFRHHLLLISIVIVFIVAIWVADLVVATIFIILFFYLFFFYRNNRTNFIKKIFTKPELYYFILGVIVCALFIYYAKSHAVQEGSYYDFFNLHIIIESSNVFIHSIIDIFLFRAKEPFTSAYTYFLVALSIVAIIQYRSLRFSRKNLKWFLIFIFDVMAVFIIIISSKWAYVNGVPRRYFVCNYISFWIAFLILIESLQTIKYERYFKSILLLTVLAGGLGTIYNFKYIWPKTLKPKINIVDEFKKLGKIGVISEYWNSYITSCPNPDSIIATPNEQSSVRNYEMTEEVFRQKHIYIIKDMWMDTFPDSLTQFGRLLIKDGIEFNIGDCNVCKYKKVK